MTPEQRQAKVLQLRQRLDDLRVNEALAYENNQTAQYDKIQGLIRDTERQLEELDVIL